MEGLELLSACTYCSQELDPKSWVSQWGDRKIQHYKVNTCERCGHKIRVPVNFRGSGHETREKSIESVLATVPSA